MGKMLKIMLAQDTDTQTGCAAALRANGFEVETVRKDGAQILRLFRQGSRPDVLIMDAFMQGTDAIGVLGGRGDCRRVFIRLRTLLRSRRRNYFNLQKPWFIWQFQVDKVLL